MNMKLRNIPFSPPDMTEVEVNFRPQIKKIVSFELTVNT